MQNVSAFYGYRYSLIDLYVNCVLQTDIFVTRDAIVNNMQKSVRNFYKVSCRHMSTLDIFYYY